MTTYDPTTSGLSGPGLSPGCAAGIGHHPGPAARLPLLPEPEP